MSELHSEHLRPHLLIKYKKPKPLEKSMNIFQTSEELGPDESVDEHNKFRRYSVVGDKGFVDRMAKELAPPFSRTVELPTVELSEKTPSLGMTPEDIHHRLMNTTQEVSRFHSDLLSRLSKHQQLSMTREKRNIDSFTHQQRVWRNSEAFARAKSQHQPKTFNSSTSRIFVENNPDLQVLINNNPTGYWSKSLRNGDTGLLKYIRGVPFEKAELQKLLQTSQGTKLIESKVPKIDTKAAKSLEESGGLVLSARSKYKSQLQNTTTDLGSLYKTDRYPGHLDEVYKADWNKRDLARKNLPMLPKMQLRQ